MPEVWNPVEAARITHDTLAFLAEIAPDYWSADVRGPEDILRALLWPDAVGALRALRCEDLPALREAHATMRYLMHVYLAERAAQIEEEWC